MKKLRNPRKWNLEELPNAVESSKSLSEVLRKLGLREAGGNHASIKFRIEHMGLDISHFDPYVGMVEQWKSTQSKTINENTVLSKNSGFSRSAVKRFARQFIPSDKCGICDHPNVWNGIPLMMQLDHINGNGNDHRKENLRWICPNCHTQTPGYAGRSSGTKTRF